MGLSPEERLEKHRTLRDWLVYQLRQEERIVKALEKELDEQRRRQEVARIEMSWKLQPNRAQPEQPMLHRGNCGLHKTAAGYINKAEAFIAIEEFPQLEMCHICAPWGSLGIERPGAG
ncbi:DUF6233 domain-containing protein [Streptomyces sp. NPDC007861]|uniref:DUF6233 domain-containing protein n=1 Tax=Streptomyces sp. NPDC007861 TaxID=3154893 RepID=UPI0034091289